MNINIPNKIKVGGLDYDIILKNRIEEDGVSDMGTQYTPIQKMWIDNTYHKQQQEETFLHKIIEAINDSYELNLEHHKICTLSNLLYQVIKQLK